MGVRFQRRITLCKGVHLNVSKSGIGISLGMRGASISTGPRGQYVNLGIPGTGLAFRQKVGDNSSDSSDSVNESNIRNSNYIEGSSINIKIDKDGKEFAYLTAPDGTPYNDEAMMRRVKKGAQYHELLEKVRRMKYDDMKNKNDSCVYIYKSSPTIITEQDVIQERENPKNIIKQEYVIHEFDEAEPRLTAFYDKAHNWALENVKYNIFNKKKKVHFAEHQKMYELFEEAKKDWEKRKEEYYENEKKTKIIKDKEFEEDYKRRASEQAYIYDQVLNPTEDYINDTVKDVLSQIELPVEFSIDYAVAGRKIELDIDLPEIEDYPQEVCTILSSGKLSVKHKTISELNKDYATGVIGMSFFFASILFNISPAIEQVSISGYTQRTNKKTGNIEDQYVYSVVFPRKNFSEINIQNIDPIQAITGFEHVMDITSKFELKTIDVKESENRKTDSEKQENQTEFYSV